MTELLKKEREFVVPGDEIVKSMEFLPGRNCFRDGDSIYSKKLGLVGLENRVVSIIPLSGVYSPHFGDMVIGEVVDITSNGWIVNIDYAADAFLPLSGVREFVRQGSDLSKIFDIGEILYTNIAVANENTLHVSMQDSRCRKLFGGKLVRINTVKVPRLIGKKGSMISMIKDRTGCNIYVGQNGVAWVSGNNLHQVEEIINKIERESHKEGLTDSIEKMLGGSKRVENAESFEEFSEEVGDNGV